MKILITGGAGFIGSHLAERLISRGDDVSVVDNISTGRIENLRHLLDSKQIKIYIDTVCNPVLMEDLIREADQVYHLAAPVGVKYIMEHPVLTILDNVRGADVVFGLCNKYRKKVLLASTSEVYGRNLDFLGDEKKKLGEEDFRLKGRRRTTAGPTRTRRAWTSSSPSRITRNTRCRSSSCASSTRWGRGRRACTEW